MSFPIFDFLEGLSPWWWVALALTLGAIEMATFSFFLIWPGLAALLMAGILVFAPGLQGAVQVALFAALSVGLTFAGRGMIVRFGDGGAPPTTINDRSAQLIGRHVRVLTVNGGEARVEVDGVQWSARLDGGEAPATGDMAEVVEAGGGQLRIRRLNHD